MKGKDYKLKYFFFTFCFLISFSFFENVQAATLYLAPESGTYQVGNIFSLSLMTNSQGAAINAAEGVLNFSPSEIEVINISKTDSIFTLWPVEPTFSNINGKIEFAGGSPKSFSGEKGKIITIIFKPKKAGITKVNFASGAILAADGIGTNVLTKMKGGVYTIKPKEELPRAEEYIAPSGTPQAPKIYSPSHPDSEKWYQDNNVILKWQISSDVKAVRILTDKNSSSIPTTYYSFPLSEKTLENQEEGIWYFHCQFQNDKGWGKVGHFKFQIDKSQPEKFEILVKEGKETSVPNPTLVFEAEDKISGIDFYEIRIGNLEPIKIKEKEYQTPFLTPGKYTIVAKAIDFAGNEAITMTEINILALEAPKITYYSKDLKPGDYLILKGLSFPEAKIEVFLEKKGKETKTQWVRAGIDGNWEMLWSEPLEEGLYQVFAKAKDKYNGESHFSEKIFIKVSQPPFLKFGQLAVNYLTIFLSLIALIILLILIIFYTRLKISQWRKRLKGETKEAVKALIEGFKVMENKIGQEIAKLDEKSGLSQEEEKIYERLKEILKKAKETIGKEIEDIEKELGIK